MAGADPCTPIGVFDSGIGGFSILRALHARLPNENILYYADQGHVPYGSKPIDEVRGFAFQITQTLLDLGAKLIVVACNTASAAALVELRKAFPLTPFVGMEPAVKPAAETTHTGIVGVLATPATFQGELYASVVERFARDVEVLQAAPAGLVQEIEAGDLDSRQIHRILERHLIPMLERGIDTLVLGCTHYPLVMRQLQAIVGPDVRVIDPSPAIARQADRMLGTKMRCQQTQPGFFQFITSGQPAILETQVRDLLGILGEVRQVGA